MAAVLMGVLAAVAAVIVPSPGRWTTGGSTDADASEPVAADLGRRIATYTTDVVTGARFQPPDRAERETVAEGVALYVDGKRADGVRKLAQVDFGVRIVTDLARDETGKGGTTPGRRYAEIYDRAAESRRGWGRVYVDLDSDARYSVQVPHPVADAYSDILGVGVLRGAPGGVLVIAGTHRDAGEGEAADAAHRTDTVFHAVWAELAARGIPALQVHGYADRSAPGHDLVVSTGAGDDARPQARTLAAGLDDAGFRVCRAWAGRCPLAGRTNTQGRLAADKGVPFLHIEVSRSVRQDRARTDRVIAELSRTAGGRW